MEDEESDYEVIAEGIASTVSRTWASVDAGEPEPVVVKTSTTIKRFSREPHDIVKEYRILRDLSHRNIISVIDFVADETQNTMNIWMPYIPYSLSALLESPQFSPRPHQYKDALNSSSSNYARKFSLLSRSLMLQTLSAVAYLHAKGIAHRDLKPSNVLLTREGRVQLIDFGIAWKEDDSVEDKEVDMWPEYRNKMYFEVSTGPYRAPELLFGTRSYDAFAIDSWSLGALFAEFFTPFSSEPSSFDDDSTKLKRAALFDATRGEIGLAWSIFKILGTPNDETWPGFKELPDAQRVEFTVVPGVPLDEKLLPNLPLEPSASGGESAPELDSRAVDLVRNLLRYPPGQRLKAQEALCYPFIVEGEPLLLSELPEGGLYPTTSIITFVEMDHIRVTLGDILKESLGRVE